MNNQELLDFYVDKLDIYKQLEKNIFFDIHQVINNTEDIIEKSVLFIGKRFNMDSLMYSMPCLFYRNGQWYKYSIYNHQPIQLNNATLLSNNELFKLIKRNLLSKQKDIIMRKFMRDEYDLVLDNLHIQKRHLISLKNLTIDSELYNNIKFLLEHFMQLDDEDFAI